MNTLNQIADYVAGKLGQPFNEQLKDEIKYYAKTWRATLIRQDLERNADSHLFYQSFVVPLIVVDEADTCVAETGCNLLRTEKAIPTPVRVKKTSPFQSISTIIVRDVKDNIQFSPYHTWFLIKHNKVTSNRIVYDYVNSFIYINGNTKLRYIRVRDIFENPEDINTCATEDSCYNDDKPFPLALDLIRVLLEESLKMEYRALNKDNQVKVEEDKISNGRN